VRIAIYGGTFDPIHDAHVQVAEEAIRVAELDRVLLIPASDPPHKPGLARAPYEDRLHMVELAVAGHPHLQASDIERRQGRSYSIDTIRELKAQLPQGTEWFFLIGADAFAEIGTWYKFAEVMASVVFLVVARPGYTYQIPTGAQVIPIESLALHVSSSEIRHDLDGGRMPGHLPPAVATYIREKGLYGFGKTPHCDIL